MLAAAADGLTPERCQEAWALCREVRTTLAQQSAGWDERPLFERQWVVRDFRKRAGMPVEHWLEQLERLERALEACDGAGVAALHVPVDQLGAYYTHMLDVARGYLAKEREKLAANARAVGAWREAAARLAGVLAEV